MPRCLLLALVVGSGCAGETSNDLVASRAAALRGVTWMNWVRVSGVDNDLTRNDTPAAWDAGAASVETISGDGFAEFTTGENTTLKAIGLSSGDAGQHYTDIDFAVYFKAGGNVDIVEGGVERASNVASYAPGDIFRVQVLASVVTYWKNGALLYTSGAAPTFPLGVDTAFRTPGATLYNVYLEDLAFWTNLVGAEAVANDLTKSAPETGYDAGASSLGALDGDGYAEFTTGERTSDKVVGLNRVDRNLGVRDIDFGIHLRANGRFAIRERGIDPAGGVLGQYQAGDLFRIEAAGGVVTYARNGVVFYTSAVAPSRRLVLDTALRTPGATVLDARLVPAGECSAATETLSQPPHHQPALSMDAAGDRLVVAGATPTPDASYAAVYRRLPSGWIREQVLRGWDSTGEDKGPAGVAFEGNTIAVGNPDEGPSELDHDGTVRVFQHDGSQWNTVQSFAGCPQLYADENFGRDVAMRGDLMAVGNDHDRVYIRRLRTSVWRPQAWLEPPGSAQGFARTVAVGGDRVFVGWQQGNGGAGAVNVYRYDATLPDPDPPSCTAPSPGRWILETTLVAPNARVGDLFPGELDANPAGTLLLAGNRQYGSIDDETGELVPNGPGEAYLYQLTPGGWQVAATLVGSAAEPDASFGYSVAFGGPDPDAPSFAVIGAPYQGPGDENVGGAPGGAYLFWNDGGAWSEVSRLLWPGPLSSEAYGAAVAAGGDAAFVYKPDGPGFDETGVTVHDVAMCAP